MRFPHPKHHFLKWVFLISFLFSSVHVAVSDPRTESVALVCGSSPSPLGSEFVPVFVRLMDNLSKLVSRNRYGVSNVNSSYGVSECHSDLSSTDCQLCFAACHDAIPRCLPAARAHVFLDGCFLRYDHHNFYNQSVSPDVAALKCSGPSSQKVGGGGASVLDSVSAGFAVGNATERAVVGGGFGVGEARGVYALAQCWKTVSAEGCKGCLEEAAKGVKGCARNGSVEGRGINAGCYLRYSTHKFYGDRVGHHGGSFGRGGLIAVVLCGAAVLMLSLFAGYAAYTKLAKAKAERNNAGRISNHFNKSSLSFKYETLEKATDYFSHSRKLGQGGAGSVYKGTLPNGKVVAVKRLVFNTKQWVDEFFNEVNLISGIKHKNLVKLLGCSIEGPESLLVYEYVKNKSLDQFIFDEQKIKTLNWKHRFSIIVGTAEGLAYLHEGLDVRIIHRDIKGSNVLLDENLSPKIADFGLARGFAADRSHLSTGIAGTLGYMAPEYLVKGQLTEKADVYSFGVLVLEIVSGRRNFAFTKDSGSLLQTVWRHYMSNTLSESIDPALRDDFPENESAEVLRIGLLCTQASAALRPSMTEVVQMMTDKTREIPKPCQPPFMKSSMRESSCSMGSYSINSLDSNLNTGTESSNSSRTPTVSTVLDIKELRE